MHDPRSEVRQLQLKLSDYVADASVLRSGWDWDTVISNSGLLARHVRAHICEPIAASAEREWQATLESISPRSPTQKHATAGGGMGSGAARRRKRVPAGALPAERIDFRAPIQDRRPSSMTLLAACTLAGVLSEDEGYAGEVESLRESSSPLTLVPRGSRRCREQSEVDALPCMLARPLYLAATTSGAVAAVVAVAAAFAIARA